MSKPKLLLADDSITIQKVVSLTFADKGMDVVAFSDGDAAIEQVDEVRPDIVLADVHMPGINGYQVCELIRSNEATKNTPVVLLVGSFEPFDREEAERVGANAHLTKPFTSIAEVVSTVENLLAEAAARDEPTFDQPGPETSDIDSLYQQSFVETVELPDRAGLEYEVEGYDDEMIQTSYAEPDVSPIVEEPLYAAVEEVLSTPTVEIEEDEAESLIAESLPKPEESAEITEEPAESTAAGMESEERREEAGEDRTEEEPARVADPFESVAAEPPPVQAYEPPVHEASAESFDDDLLELPGGTAPRRVEYTVPNGREVVSLSPELIELIVQKVVERLAESDRADEARSMSGS